MDELLTSASVIDALGGLAAVASLTGSQYRAVANWKSFNSFPPRTYLVMIEALRVRGFTAPPALWGMVTATAGAAE
jgi:hypothetical protein